MAEGHIEFTLSVCLCVFVCVCVFQIRIHTYSLCIGISCSAHNFICHGAIGKLFGTKDQDNGSCARMLHQRSSLLVQFMHRLK